MAKDPAFLFYYQDFLVGTDEFTNEEVGAYIRCLCIQAAKGGISEDHMKKICESYDLHNIIKQKFVWFPEEKVFRNERLSLEIEKRKKYCESRGKNKKGKKHIKIISKSYDQHMEDENENIIIEEVIKQLESLNNIKVASNEKNYYMFLVVEMSKIFTEEIPEYFFDKETDYSACLQIAYNIAKMKKWSKVEVLNGKMNETIESWKVIVAFIKTDDWLKTRSLTDISSVKEWQRLVLKMKKPENGTNKQPAYSVGRTSPNDKL